MGDDPKPIVTQVLEFFLRLQASQTLIHHTAEAKRPLAGHYDRLLGGQAGRQSRPRASRQVNLAAVSANGIALQWAPASCRASNSCRAPATCWPRQERFKKDKGVALAAVTSAGHALKYVDKDR